MLVFMPGIPVCPVIAQNAKINKMAPTCQNKNKTSKQPTATDADWMW